MKLLKLLKVATAALALCIAYPVSAGPASAPLISCFADNTSGRERKELARWLFSSMSARPELRDIASATAPLREQSSQSVGRLFTRLLSESCPAQYRAAAKAEGSTAVGEAFESLGKLAMQELMTSADVRAAIGGFEKFVDRKIEAALKE
jgi:hypothetical protein